MKAAVAKRLQSVALDTCARHVNIVRPSRETQLGKEYCDARHDTAGLKFQVEITLEEHDDGFERLSPEVLLVCANANVGLIRTRPGRYQTTNDGDPVGNPEWERETQPDDGQQDVTEVGQ